MTHPSSQKAKTTQHPLIRRGLHRLDHQRCVQNQAVIIEVFPSNSPIGDLAIIQYFEWFMGEPSTQAVVPVTALADPEWVLYASVEEMNEHYDRVDSHRIRHVRDKPIQEVAEPTE